MVEIPDFFIMKKLVLAFLLIALIYEAFTQSEKIVPTFEQVISLRSAFSPTISPDGKHVLFSVRTTNWKDNSYDTEIWLSKNGEEPFQLTNTLDGSSNNAQWSPDGQWISFVAKRDEKSQIHVLRMAGGEAKAVTNLDKNVNGYEWAPDGKHFYLTLAEDESKEDKDRKKKYGAYAVEDEEYKRSHLWVVAFDPEMRNPSEYPCEEEDSTKTNCIEFPEPEQLTEGEFTVTSFDVSPDGKFIAIQHQPNPLINSFFDSDISLLNTETKELVSFVNNPSYDGGFSWSPDSRSLVYSSNLDNRTSNFYANNQYFIQEIAGGKAKPIATRFDENLYGLTWRPQGIFATANQKTNTYLYKIDPQSGKTTQLPAHVGESRFQASFSKDGKYMAYGANSPVMTSEIFLSETGKTDGRKLTDMSAQISNWQIAQSEVISWKSQDGATIEGILHKPQNYDPNKKYPLLVMIHGGPTGVDRPTPVPGYVYPALQWLAKGALILRPNYRGSAGYGAKFRALNVENLGVGDAWDVLSGIDYLDKKGMIDTDRMGAMGWSQGGYISAFLTTTTDRFKAISVGAGISNWMTYYVNTDIHPFTRQYLKATPWENQEIYKKTSPMTYINQAKTPTLIQHGEFDRRVPVPNAYELYQGLLDVGVESKLIIYKGFGHGISKPKERLAATRHNWDWFEKYVFK